MNEWLAGQNFQWRLCYRASSDGWGAKDFHSKCDNQGPTVVIVQVGNFIFGGFTTWNWSECRHNGGLMYTVSFRKNLIQVNMSIHIPIETCANGLS